MVRVFVDTSAILAVFDPHDERGARARAWLGESSGTSMSTHSYVLCETLALAERRLGRNTVEQIRARFFSLVDVCWIARDEHERALDAHLRDSRRSSFVDQVSFVAMRDAGIDTAFAFDDDFARAGFTVVP